MKRNIRALITQFVSDLEAAVREEATNAVTERFTSIVGQFTADTKVATVNKVSAKPASAKKAHPLLGRKIEEQACPVTGTMNKARRWCFLMPEYRTADNLRRAKAARATAKKLGEDPNTVKLKNPSKVKGFEATPVAAAA